MGPATLLRFQHMIFHAKTHNMTCENEKRSRPYIDYTTCGWLGSVAGRGWYEGCLAIMTYVFRALSSSPQSFAVKNNNDENRGSLSMPTGVVLSNLKGIFFYLSSSRLVGYHEINYDEEKTGITERGQVLSSSRNQEELRKRKKNYLGIIKEKTRDIALHSQSARSEHAFSHSIVLALRPKTCGAQRQRGSHLIYTWKNNAT